MRARRGDVRARRSDARARRGDVRARRGDARARMLEILVTRARAEIDAAPRADPLRAGVDGTLSLRAERTREDRGRQEEIGEVEGKY